MQSITTEALEEFHGVVLDLDDHPNVGIILRSLVLEFDHIYPALKEHAALCFVAPETDASESPKTCSIRSGHTTHQSFNISVPSYGSGLPAARRSRTKRTSCPRAINICATESGTFSSISSSIRGRMPRAEVTPRAAVETQIPQRREYLRE